MLHKIQGYQGHQNVSKCRPHHSGDICTIRGNNLKPSFSFMGQNVNKIYILGLFWGPWEGLQLSEWAYLAFQLSSHPYLCTCEIRKQSDKKFLSLNPKYDKNNTFFIFGGSWAGLTSNPGEQKFQDSKTSLQSRQIYNRGKNNHQFFIYGPQCAKMHILGYSGWPINNQTGPILLPSYPLTYIKLHIKYGCNPMRIF